MKLELPKGCYVNFDLKSIDFLTRLLKDKLSAQESLYNSLKVSKGRRPTISEFYQAKGNIQVTRKSYGYWFGFVNAENDLKHDQQHCLQNHNAFFKDVESTALTKSWKIILLEAMVEMNGFIQPPTTKALAIKSHEVVLRHPHLLSDLPSNIDKKIQSYGISTGYKTRLMHGLVEIKKSKIHFLK